MSEVPVEKLGTIKSHSLKAECGSNILLTVVVPKPVKVSNAKAEEPPLEDNTISDSHSSACSDEC